MVMSSGKSISMTALLVVLVVAVAGTCASAAQAQYSYDITNNCSKTIVIKTATHAYTLAPGGSLHVTVPPNAVFIAPVTITTTGTPPVTVTIPPTALDQLNKLGDKLQKIEIRCDGKCITLFVTYKPPLTTISLGPYCP